MQWSSLLTLAVASLVCAGPITSPESQPVSKRQSGPIVNLGYAAYQGVSDPVTGYNTFYNVKYAAPPTGNPPSHVP